MSILSPTADEPQMSATENTSSKVPTILDSPWKPPCYDDQNTGISMNNSTDVLKEGGLFRNEHDFIRHSNSSFEIRFQRQFPLSKKPWTEKVEPSATLVSAYITVLSSNSFV